MKKLIKKIILGIIPKIQETEYDYIYSSRRVIKNSDINKNTNSFYDIDIWKLANNEIAQFLPKGFSAYYEIVGYLPSGRMIQKDYDYGFKNPIEHGSTKHTLGFNYGIFIYRITHTNTDGKVFEFSAKQVQDWCKKNGLNAVPELYYGYAKDLGKHPNLLHLDKPWDSDAFLNLIKSRYNEKDCYMCSTPQPEEGAVVRIEGTDFEAYKAKSWKFYERESSNLDENTLDIESEG